MSSTTHRTPIPNYLPIQFVPTNQFPTMMVFPSIPKRRIGSTFSKKSSVGDDDQQHKRNVKVPTQRFGNAVPKPPIQTLLNRQKEMRQEEEKTNSILPSLSNSTKQSPHKENLGIKLGLTDFECKPFESVRLPSIIDKNYLVVDNEGCTQLALFPNHLPKELCKTIEAKCRRISKLREGSEKTSFYAGWWSKSQPMGYLCKDNETPIGKILNEIVELLSDTCRNLMRKCNEKVYSKLSELNEEKLFAPCVCLNVLEPSLNSRITKPHHDKMDYGVSTLFYFGDYSGGNLNISHAGSQSIIVTRPGDAVILRGNYYKHSVGNIEPGPNQARYSLVFFAHTTHFKKKKYALSPAKAKKAFISDHPDYIPLKKRKRTEPIPNSQKKRKSRTNVEYIQKHSYKGEGYRNGYKNYRYYVKIENKEELEWESYDLIPIKMVVSYWKSVKSKKANHSFKL